VRNPRRAGVPTRAMSPPFPITITLAGDSEFAMNSCQTSENSPSRHLGEYTVSKRRISREPHKAVSSLPIRLRLPMKC
jgi:hypothetical protein